jgi:periplasmic copper chaperone A
MKFPVLTVSVALTLLGACGSPQAPPQAVTPIATVGSIAISEPRVRLPVAGRDQTAAYLTLTNTGTQADRLVGVSSPAANKLELHAHLKTADGLTAMREITSIDVPAGATIPLSPGGLHIMVKGIKAPMIMGQTMLLEVAFASGKKAIFAAPIVSNPKAQEEGLTDEGGGHKH